MTIINIDAACGHAMLWFLYGVTKVIESMMAMTSTTVIETQRAAQLRVVSQI